MILKFWGKKKEEAGEETNYHPLLLHLIDVAAVAELLWDRVCQRHERTMTAQKLGLSSANLGKWLAFWAGLHDLGKATPAFQSKWEPARRWLTEAGLKFQERIPTLPHGILTVLCLESCFRNYFPSLPQVFAYRLAVALGGHHGVFPRAVERINVTKAAIGGKIWEEKRAELCRQLAALFDIQTLPLPAEELPDQAFFLFLAGLVSVADWIGSNIDFFPFAGPETELAAYRDKARHQAEEALRVLGWLGWQAPATPLSMAELFPALQAAGLRPLQQATVTLAAQLSTQSLVVIEAPMGEGKTEAALFLADWWLTILGEKGCYVALPTMATSNQMFSRVKDFLAHRYPQNLVNLQLLHGHASLSAEFQVLRQRGYRLFAPSAIAAEDETTGTVLAAEWFTHRKRGLLAPFGVGTVDQALLAVLSTRHYFVRLFGLAHKTIIIDEVHAYDAYMVKLLERLLEWLASLGCSVVLLSATLPRQRRFRLLAAYAKGLQRPDLVESDFVAPYPRLSWVGPHSGGDCHFPASSQFSRQITLHWLQTASQEVPALAAELGPRLQQVLATGGCAVIICNTVARAQQLYAGLKTYFPGTDQEDGWPELDLLHARFPLAQREQRELRTLTRFGKPKGWVDWGEGRQRPVRRPRRAVLVATQVIEQSLDLDFDLMISDLAPVDLLLQRAGRLHRHNRPRPPLLATPQLWLCPPAYEAGLPVFDAGTLAVYDHHILLRSWLALRDRPALAIPQEIEKIIEWVYGDGPPPALPDALRQIWEETWQKLSCRRQEEEQLASRCYILPPYYPDELLAQGNAELEEDNPEIHRSLQAATRLGDPALMVTFLYELEGKVFLDSAYNNQVDLLSIPTAEQLMALLQQSVSLSHRGLTSRLLVQGEIPPGWRHHPLLCRHRLLRLDVQGCWRDEKYELRLDPEQGVIITSRGKD